MKRLVWALFAVMLVAGVVVIASAAKDKLEWDKYYQFRHHWGVCEGKIGNTGEGPDPVYYNCLWMDSIPTNLVDGLFSIRCKLDDWHQATCPIVRDHNFIYLVDCLNKGVIEMPDQKTWEAAVCPS